MGFPSISVVKNPPAMQDMRFQALGQEDPLEKEMATHSSILSWEISWTEDPGGLQTIGLHRVESDMTSPVNNKILIAMNYSIH